MTNVTHLFILSIVAMARAALASSQIKGSEFAVPTVHMRLFTSRDYLVESEQVNLVIQRYSLRDFILSKRGSLENLSMLKVALQEINTISRFHDKFELLVSKYSGAALLVQLQNLDVALESHLGRVKQRNGHINGLFWEDLMIPSNKVTVKLSILTRITIPQSVYKRSFETIVKAAIEVSKLYHKVSFDYPLELDEMLVNLGKSMVRAVLKSDVLLPLRFMSCIAGKARSASTVNDAVLAGLLVEGVDPRVLSCVCKHFSSQSIIERAVKASAEHQLVPIIQQMYPFWTDLFLHGSTDLRVREKAVSALLSAVYFRVNCGKAYKRVGYKARCRLLCALLSSQDRLSITERTFIVFLSWIKHLPLPMASSDWEPMLQWVLAGRRQDASFLRLMREHVDSVDLDTKIASRMVMVDYCLKFDNVPTQQPPVDIYDHTAWTRWLQSHARL